MRTPLIHLLTAFALTLSTATTTVAAASDSAMSKATSAKSTADYSREQRIEEQIIDAIMVGDPVHLEQKNHHTFLTIYTPAEDEAKGAVVLVHGVGVNPEWGFIGHLRQSLAEAGYATLSIQAPVLAAEADSKAYHKTFPEAAERIALALDFLADKGFAKPYILSHSMGSRMAYHFMTTQKNPAVSGWLAIGMPGTMAFKATVPVLDLYGEKDLPQVLENAAKRKQCCGTRMHQKEIKDADHFFTDRYNRLHQEALAFLEGK